MRDIPMFTTENGVASLILREIPYRGEAYIRMLDTACPEDFLAECLSFCRIAGAEKVYATGHPYLHQYPLYTKVYRLMRPIDGLRETDAMTFPVTTETLVRWRELYNRAMASVPNASYMDSRDGKKLLEEGNGYFVHRRGELLGIGIASDENIRVIAAVKPGAGEDVLLALTHALTGENVIVEVASENHRAMRFYDRMGFIKAAELSTWYQVL